MKAARLRCSDSGDKMYLRHCLPGTEDLCDLILVAGQKRFPAHSQYLASHSHFIRQLILETGPFTWQHPLIIDQVLHGHSSACVHLLLMGVYNMGILLIDSPYLAWQLSKLTDQLNCPNMLRSCRLYLNQMPMCRPDNALHWLTVTAHEAELEGLHANCASKIAGDFDRVAKDKRLASLPTAQLMRIMAVMSQQNSQNASQPQANKQMCQICQQSEQQAIRLGRKRKLLTDPQAQMRESSQSSSDSDSESDSESEEEDAAAAAVAAAAGPAAPLESSSSDDGSGSEEEEGPDPAVAAAAAAAAGDAVIAAVARSQGEQSSSEESESEDDSSSEDDSLPKPQVAVGSKPASEEGSLSEEESSSEDDSKPGPQAASAADDSSSEEESSDEESSDGE